MKCKVESSGKELHSNNTFICAAYTKKMFELSTDLMLPDLFQ